ncbi:M23 family peptidase [Putridiphycobacter roseus]|uniref:M23 family peptidase n=1 Tax=Putridiphycobacter roseus TaxID=2219161 RepID=A0A2W1MWE3_9FLAO|nr:M23 family metallopeptidase [Putridiphycobacter roseus]PZE15704.1 M23 family peptidase [Putridiphycobacter roseus]
MARGQKYKYNIETLDYEKVKSTFGQKLLKSLLVIAPAIVLGFVFQFVFSLWFISPSEAKLKQENKFLQTKLENQTESLNLMDEVLKNIEEKDNGIYRVIFNAQPFPSEYRKMGTGGAEDFEDLKGHELSEKLIENAKKIKALEKRLYAQSLSFDELKNLATEKENMLGAIPAIQPITNKDLTRIASGFGVRIDPHYHTQRMHQGLDFSAPTGTNVMATGNGVVEVVEKKIWGYGNSIVINHGYGYKTRYAHLNAFNVKKGQKVMRGQIIGYVGTTGKSTGPHLHYEVMKNKDRVNPIHFFHSDLTPEDFEKIIEMSNNVNQSFD